MVFPTATALEIHKGKHTAKGLLLAATAAAKEKAQQATGRQGEDDRRSTRREEAKKAFPDRGGAFQAAMADLAMEYVLWLRRVHPAWRDNQSATTEAWITSNLATGLCLSDEATWTLGKVREKVNELKVNELSSINLG